ncbi:MAG: hypothetical protein AAF357_14780, partial [Verrucomicrobiota bacterium]
MAISTDGWDMIATATQGAINTALNGINAARPTPVSVDKKIPLGGSHLNVTLDANFEALQINALKQGLDIMNIVVTIGDNSTIKIPLVGTQPLDGLQLVLEMALTYVKSDLQPASGTNYDFTIDFTNKAAFQKVSLEVLPGWLSGDLFLVAAIQIVLLEVLEDWAATNPSVTVATVNLGDVSQDFPALVPSQAFYSFNLNESSPDDTPFQVLMLTTGQTQGAFNSTTQYIPTDSNAAALISNNLLMSGILLPAVASGMNAPQSDFSVNSSGQLSMSVDSISFTSDGYTIDVSAFTAEVNSSNQIAISMDASTSVWLGIIDVDMSASANLSVLEVEAAIHRHPYVHEAGVFSVPDMRLGEAVGAG